MEIKLVISNPSTGKSYQKQVEDSSLLGMKIGDKVSGDLFGLPGYELEIRGGSDSAGFPMRRDVDTSGRKHALLTEGPGVHINRKGMKKRKTIRGNTIDESTAQVSVKVVKSGSRAIEDILGLKKEENHPVGNKQEKKKTE